MNSKFMRPIHFILLVFADYIYNKYARYAIKDPFILHAYAYAFSQSSTAKYSKYRYSNSRAFLTKKGIELSKTGTLEYRYEFKPSNNKRNLKWEQRYEELKEYKAMHGNVNVSQTCKENPGLGQWVRRQRTEYGDIVNLLWNKGKRNGLSIDADDSNILVEYNDSDVLDFNGCDDLTRYRIQKLLELGFVFDLKKSIWNTRLSEIHEFKKIHGHARVPQHYKQGEKWYKLGLWVRNQRAMYNRLINSKTDLMSTAQYKGDGRDSVTYNFLTEERIQLLNAAGFCWDAQGENWMEHYDKLSVFRKEHGFADVPSRYRDDPALSRWVQQQRRNKDTLTQERIKLLDELDFVWGNKNDMHWWNNYGALCEYKRLYGTCIVPSNHDDYKLYNWVNNTKRKCKEFRDLVTTKEQLIDGKCYSAVSGLDRERINALIKIDFCWLPSIGEDGEITPRPIEKKPVIRLRSKKPKDRHPLKPKFAPVVPPPKEKKAFIPFPWDDI